MDFKILNWNLGGAKYLELEENARRKFRQALNKSLRQLIVANFPHVVTLQEIVSYGTSKDDAEDIIDPIPGYRYLSFPLIDTYLLSAEAKWRKLKKKGNWPNGYYFTQGNAFMFRDDVPHYPVWNLSANNEDFDKSRHFVEQVNVHFGLYFGDRNTEPRAALVAHFIFKPDGEYGRPLDVFVINLHLTTLMLEREGIPKIDEEASRIRLAQLEIVFHGIISQYNTWRQQGYLMRSEPRKKEDSETYDRYPPVWILVGDFNFTPESMEYAHIRRMNFVDVVKNKGLGTKSKGIGVLPTITVDYIFAGPEFISLDPLITNHAIQANGPPDYSVRISDHYPLFATIPLAIQSIRGRIMDDSTINQYNHLLSSL